jgi:hypothetical protein
MKITIPQVQRHTQPAFIVRRNDSIGLPPSIHLVPPSPERRKHLVIQTTTAPWGKALIEDKRKDVP